MEIESVLIRLRETTAEINQATDDPGVKASLEQTWLLQDRLMFPNQVRESGFVSFSFYPLISSETVRHF